MSDNGSGGWIKLHRRCLHHPDLTAFDEKGIWCDLLMMAAHEPRTTVANGQTIALARGQMAVNVSAWAADGGVSPKRMRTIMAKLRAKGMIETGQARGKAATIVTICNYDLYQGREDAKGKANGEAPADLGQSKGQTIEEEIQESPTSYVESEPVVVSRVPAREEAPAGADGDEPELAQAIERFCHDRRLQVRGITPRAARQYVESVRPSYRMPGQLASAIRQSLLPDQGNPIGVLIGKASRFGVAVQVAVEGAARPRLDPNLEALKRELARSSTDRDRDAHVDPADRYLAHQAAAGA